ncbi:hypothetical protein JCGZ_00085 [Jatropha curcas]|uniref:Uncharacterized protein n=1 Tax=Jatropha curcas TaxID=180498 RepID=A0A067JUH7_JATCU|nr:hypothetical protein JCGZ_00085 [Jatropha curcas]
MPEHGPVASFSFILDHPGHARETSRESIPDVTARLHPLSIDDYNEVCQLYEVAHLKLAEARLSDELIFRVDMVPSYGRGRGMRHGGHMDCRARCQLVIIKETEESGREDSKEMASNMS